ncbi:MAG TPA: energy transducer TonB [Terracidiphilus sp.]|nr:energy transducer TonB [Terracidiphilus sp.]
MSLNETANRTSFGLLPEPEGRSASFVTSMVVNGLILLLVLYIGTMARKTLIQRQYQETLLILPSRDKEPPPPPKVKLPPIEQPKIPEMKFDAPKIALPKPEPKPEVKPLQMEAKLTAPVIKAAKPQVILSPQPKAAFGAAMPAQDKNVKVSTKPVHFGDTFGVTPNPNAHGRATVAAIGNPYGGMQGPAVAPHGIVGSTGFGNGTHFGSSAGVVGRVASAGVPRATNTAPVASHGRVASAGIPTGPSASAPVASNFHERPPTSLEVLSKPPVQYTSEARQLKVQGDVVLRVTFTASGQVVVKSIVHGLGHGLDEEARRVAQQIRFRPATRNGQSVDTTTNITITFQLA